MAVKSNDLDLEPSSRISNAFDADSSRCWGSPSTRVLKIAEHLDDHDKKLDKLQYNLNQAYH